MVVCGGLWFVVVCGLWWSVVGLSERCFVVGSGYIKWF